MEFGLRERLEDDDLVDAVEELRAEVLAQRLLHRLLELLLLAGAVAAAGEAERGLLLHSRAQVAGHDDDGVAEVDGAAVAVGQAAVVEDLEERVEDVGVRLLDLVEEDDAVGAAADGLGEPAALVVADVAGR